MSSSGIQEITSENENTTIPATGLAHNAQNQDDDVVHADWENVAYHPSSLYVQTIVSASLADFFVTFLPCEDSRLKAVFWQFEGAMLRVWTIISSDDFEFEKRIYSAEKSFLTRFQNVQSDFYVVFQEDRDLAEVTPADSHQAYPKQ